MRCRLQNLVKTTTIQYATYTDGHVGECPRDKPMPAFSVRCNSNDRLLTTCAVRIRIVTSLGRQHCIQGSTRLPKNWKIVQQRLALHKFSFISDLNKSIN